MASALWRLLPFALAWGAPVALAAPRLEVRGASHIDVRTSHTTDSLAVSATLLDDVDRPIRDATVLVRFAAADGTSLRARPCAPPPGSSAVPGTEAVSVTTDPDGTLCVRADRPAGGGAATAKLAFAGSHLLKGSEADASIDPSRAAVELSFDPATRGPQVVMLGEGAVSLNAVATLDDPSLPSSDLVLHLEGEHGRHLADAPTDRKGVARFVVPEAALGAPGPGVLRLSFDGDGRHAHATREVPCERRVRVVLRPHEVDANGRARAEETEAGVQIDVDALTAQGSPVPGGSVEGVVDGAVVGAAPIVAARARLTLPAASARGKDVRIGVRYVPDVPWYVAGRPAALDLGVRRTLLLRRLGVMALGLAVFAWFFLARSRLFATFERAKGAKVAGGHEPAAMPTARIDVLAAHGDARTTWEGRVVDAHDGGSVRHATIVLERAGFGAVEKIAETTADDAGRFVLDAPSARPGDQLSVEGRLHQRLVRAAPAHGTVEVSLVSRRRAVLRRLVDWARGRGGPFATKHEPTPGQVRRAAGDGRTARWATAVEGAAFGHAEVDARVEMEVDALGHEGEDSSSGSGAR
jgi:hypothetical protein